MTYYIPPKHAFAHYFSPYTFSGGASPAAGSTPSTDDEFVKYLTPGGTTGSAPYGGFVRDQPIGRGATTSASWSDIDSAAEITNAIAGGLDGFTVDILNTAYGQGGTHWLIQDSLFRAGDTFVAAGEDFGLIPMFDMGPFSSVTPTTLANRAKTLFAHTSAYTLPNGKYVLSAFHAEHWANGGSDTAAQAVTNWNAAIALIEAAGFPVAFVPCFLNYDSSKVAFQGITAGKMVGASSWGNRSPAGQTGDAARAADAHAKGWYWMQAVSVQDERPHEFIYDEAVNSQNLEASWSAASGYPGTFSGSPVAGGVADQVQCVTWNDFSEGTQFAPSKYNGTAYRDLSAWYCNLWKNGLTPSTAPLPTKDTLVLNHRIQHSYPGCTITGQTQFQARRSGTSPASDKAEVVSILTAPGTMKLNVGGVITTAAVPAGLSRTTATLGAGIVTATLSRTGASDMTVQTPLAVPSPITSASIQNEQYIAAISARTPPAPPPSNLTADFEHGTNGVTIAITDTGSASKFDTDAGAAGGAGTTAIYDNTHTRGTLAAKFATGATLAATSLKWSTSLTATADAGPFYSRAYLYVTANPTPATVPISFMSGAFTNRVGVRITNAGNLAVLVNGVTTVDATTKNTIPLNQWFRVELDATGSTTAGGYSMRLYTTADSPLAIETLVNSGINTGGTIDSIAFGCTQQAKNQVAFWMDDLAASAVGPIGPTGTVVAGPTGTLTFSSLAGTVSTPQSFSAAPATLTFSAPAGSLPVLAVTLKGPSGTLTFSSPAGTIGDSVTADPASLSLTAPQGALDIPPLLFRTPTIRLSPSDPQGESLWLYYAIDVGVTVMKMQDGTYRTTTFPTQDDLDAAVTYYMGGHEYEVSSDEWSALTAAGLTS